MTARSTLTPGPSEEDALDAESLDATSMMPFTTGITPTRNAQQGRFLRARLTQDSSASRGRSTAMPLVRRLAVVLTVVPIFALASTAHAARGGSAGADAVIAWNANAGEAAIAACISPIEDPLHESRMYAMTHVAIHDALNAIDRRSHPYAWDGRAKRRASPDAAVAAAARDVLVALLNEITDPFPPACGDRGRRKRRSGLQAALGGIPDGRAKTRGIEVGQAAASAILGLRAADGCGHPVDSHGLPTRHCSWRVALHARFRLRVRAGMGGRHAVRAERQFAVPSGSALRADPKEVHRGLR